MKHLEILPCHQDMRQLRLVRLQFLGIGIRNGEFRYTSARDW